MSSQHPSPHAAPSGARSRRRRPAGREPAGRRPFQRRHDARPPPRSRSHVRSPARHRPRRRVRPGRRHGDEDPRRLARRRRGQDRDHAVPAAADAGRRRRRADLPGARHAGLSDHDPRRARPVLLQPGAAAVVRLQPCRGAARLPDGAEARSELRRLLLGRGADPRAQHQRADDAGGEPAGAGRAREGGGPQGSRRSQGAGADRGAAAALLGRPQGRAPGAGCGLCRRDAEGRRALPGRRHDRRAPCRERDGHPAVGLLGGRRRHAEGPRRRDRLQPRDGAQAQPHARRRHPSLHPRGRGVDRAGAGAAVCRPPRRADARRRPHRAHAGTHLLPGGPVPALARHQQARGRGRRAATSRARPPTRSTRAPTTRTTSTS